MSAGTSGPKRLESQFAFNPTRNTKGLRRCKPLTCQLRGLVLPIRISPGFPETSATPAPFPERAQGLASAALPSGSRSRQGGPSMRRPALGHVAGLHPLASHRLAKAERVEQEGLSVGLEEVTRHQQGANG